MGNITSTKQFIGKPMDIRIKQDSPANISLGQNTLHASQDTNGINKAEKRADSIHKQLNISILQAGLDFSVRAGNESMALLYKTAIGGINEVLKDEFGDNAIQNAYDSSLDISPEATAERIVSMSTGFFFNYREQNPELSEQEAAKSFVEIIGGGIDKGFAEAREILEGLQVLEGNIATNIDATYKLVQKGLQDFINKYLQVS